MLNLFSRRSGRGTKKPRPLSLEQFEDRCNPAAPVFTSLGGGDTAAVSVVENTYDVARLTATGDLGKTLTYSIAGGADASRFAINRATGVLTFAAAPNFEQPTDSGANNVYDVTVRVSDGSLTDTQAIAVSVLNSTSEAQGKSPVLQVPYRTDVNLSTVERLYKSAAYKIEVRRAGTGEAYTESFVFETKNDWVYKDWWGADPNKVTRTSTQYGYDKSDIQTASFTNISFKDTAVEVRITLLGGRVANTVNIRPLQFGMQPTISGDKKVISFTLSEPRKLSVEINDRINPLFLFADAPDDQPDPGVTYYFGPGAHRIAGNGTLTLKSNERVYVAAGAIVEGRFVIQGGATNVTIRGRGIVSGGEWAHPGPLSYTALRDLAAVWSDRTSNFTLEGLTMVQNPSWQVAINDFSGNGTGTYNNLYSNLKMVSFAGNTDGFWVTGNNNRVENSFVFNNDDIIVNKGGSGTVVTDLTVWRGVWGRLLLHHLITGGYTTSTNLTLQNIDVIGSEGGLALIHAETDRAGQSIVNTVLRDIRVEERRRPGNTNNTDSIHKLIPLVRLSEGSPYRVAVNGLTFENVNLFQKLPFEGFLNGTSDAPIQNVTFRNLTMGGQLILSAAAANITIQGNVSNVKWLAPNSEPTNITLSNASAPIGVVGATVGTLSATDPDAGETFTYSLPANMSNNWRFEIVNGNRLRVAVPPPAGTTTQWVTVRVTDSQGATYDKAFQITFFVNAAPTNVALSNTTVARTPGATVGTLSGTDPNAGDTLTYSLPPNLSNNWRFTIDGTQLKLVTPPPAGTTTQWVTVRVTDAAGEWYEKAFQITIL